MKIKKQLEKLKEIRICETNHAILSTLIAAANTSKFRKQIKIEKDSVESTNNLDGLQKNLPETVIFIIFYQGVCLIY